MIARWIKFDAYSVHEDCFNESILNVGYHPEAKDYNSRVLKNPSQRLKKGYEAKFLELIEAEHRGFEEGNNTYYGSPQKSQNNE